MPDETEIRPGGEADAGDGDGERAGQQSPLQGRAAFINNWDWQFITSLNRGSCDRGKAQFGNNSEAHDRIRQRWDSVRAQSMTLGEALALPLPAVLLLESPAGFRARNLFVSENALSRV